MVRPLLERGKAAFGTFLANFDFNSVICVGDFDKTFSAYFDQIFGLYEKAFPKVSTTVRSKNPAPWMTYKLKQCLRKRSKLYKLYLKGKISKVDYAWFRNRVTSILRRSKRLYFAKLFCDADGDAGRMWSIINSVMEKRVKFRQSV